MGGLILNRRRFLQGTVAVAGLGFLAGCGILSSQSQPAKIHRIGFLADFPDTYFSYFLDGLSERGYVEGEAFMVEKRYARGEYDRFPDPDR